MLKPDLYFRSNEVRAAHWSFESLLLAMNPALDRLAYLIFFVPKATLSKLIHLFTIYLKYSTLQWLETLHWHTFPFSLGYVLSSCQVYL